MLLSYSFLYLFHFPSVYSDVPLAMASWFKKRIKMYIYSSGSVEAQKLLFGNSVAGDLLKVWSVL